MGLPVAGQHLWGSFVSGTRRAVPIRQTQNDLAIRFLQFTGNDGQELSLNVARPPFVGIADLDTRDGRWGLWQPGSTPRFAYATSATSALWREQDEFEVVAEPLGDAMQLAIPDADEPLGYRARWWRVTSGTWRGEPVTGVFGHEQVYVRTGTGWFSSPYCRHLEQAWVVFVTEYADGFPRELAFTLGDGSQWVYTAPETGAQMPIPGPADSTPRWREGTVRAVGETREVRFAHAWAEAFPARF